LKQIAFAVIALTAFGGGAASAQIPILIEHSGDDRIGKQLAFELRDQIKASATFVETRRPSEAAVAVYLVTLNPDDDSKTNWMIYSYTLVIPNQGGLDQYITSSVGKCGVGVIDDCAGRMIRNTGAHLEEVRDLIPANARP
jgi:hypothetical protein